MGEWFSTKSTYKELKLVENETKDDEIYRYQVYL